MPDVVHAAVSTTALHWLATDRLVALYRVLAERLAPGGVLVNGDHLGLSGATLHRLARTVRDRRAQRAGVLGNEEWRAWWDAVLAEPEFAGLARERADRQHADHNGHGNGLTVDAHAELLSHH